jgi:hypothetical protein
MYTAAVGEIPEHVGISPMAVVCPRCHAKPSDVCEILFGEGLEIIHIERIKLALAMDVSAKERLAHGRIPSKPSE